MPKPHVQSHAADDAQIDLLTLASALMLTVMCLLLSQILTEKATSGRPEEDTLPEVHRLRVKLTIPHWSGGDASLAELQGHPVIARDIGFGSRSKMHAFRAGETVSFEDGPVRCRVAATRRALGPTPLGEADLSWEIEVTPDAGESFERDLFFAVVSPVSPPELPAVFPTLWDELAGIGDTHPPLVRGALEYPTLPKDDRNPHGALRYSVLNEQDPKARTYPEMILPGVKVDYQAGKPATLFLCGQHTSKTWRAFNAAYLERLEANHHPVKSVTVTGLEGITTQPSPPLDQKGPLVFHYRLLVGWSPPAEGEGETHRRWTIALLPTARHPGWPPPAP